MLNTTFSLAMAAFFVSQPSYDIYTKCRNSKYARHRRAAVTHRARSVILFDRVMRGDLRSIEKC